MQPLPVTAAAAAGPALPPVRADLAAAHHSERVIFLPSPSGAGNSEGRGPHGSAPSHRSAEITQADPARVLIRRQTPVVPTSWTAWGAFRTSW